MGIDPANIQEVKAVDRALTPVVGNIMNPGYAESAPMGAVDGYNTGQPGSDNLSLQRNNYRSQSIAAARLTLNAAILLEVSGKCVMFGLYATSGTYPRGWLFAIYFDDNQEPIYWDTDDVATPSFPAAGNPIIPLSRPRNLTINGMVYGKIKIVVLRVGAVEASAGSWFMQVVTFSNPVEIRFH